MRIKTKRYRKCEKCERLMSVGDIDFFCTWKMSSNGDDDINTVISAEILLRCDHHFYDEKIVKLNEEDLREIVKEWMREKIRKGI